MFLHSITLFSIRILIFWIWADHLFGLKKIASELNYLPELEWCKYIWTRQFEKGKGNMFQDTLVCSYKVKLENFLTIFILIIWQYVPLPTVMCNKLTITLFLCVILQLNFSTRCLNNQAPLSMHFSRWIGDELDHNMWC